MPLHDLPPIEQFPSLRGMSPANRALCEQSGPKPRDSIFGHQVPSDASPFRRRSMDTYVAPPSKAASHRCRLKTQNSLWVDRIKGAVDSELKAKGWTPVESGGQVAVVAMEMNRNQRTLNTFYNGFGGGWRWGGGFGNATTTVDTYKVGTLVVDLFDANTKGLIWRGSSSDTLSNKSDKNIKNLDKGVQKMFEHFPPEAKR